MKKTFLAMLMAGSSMAMFAQTTPTTDPNNTTTNSQMNSSSTTTTSTSWTPETTPYWGWNSYGIWNNASANTTDMNTSSSGTNLNSSGSYNAYGTSVANLPANVQMRFNQDFPNGVNNTYTWNQYGDWFNTYYMNNGRLTQYFYDTRGNGYSLALPVIQTYVPENIITSALQKFGSSLYSIAMVKTNNGSNAYQVGLLQHGQMATQYLDDNGATVTDVWRTENINNGSTMSSTQSNAAMDNSANQSNMNTDMNSQSNMNSDMNSQSTDNGKTKLKIKHEDGSIDKIKTKNGHTKVKSKPAPDNMNNQ